MIITLKVKKHAGTGKMTLTETREGDRMARDCEGELARNDDAGTFYRAVARYLHILHREEHNVAYEDVTY